MESDQTRRIGWENAIKDRKVRFGLQHHPRKTRRRGRRRRRRRIRRRRRRGRSRRRRIKH